MLRKRKTRERVGRSPSCEVVGIAQLKFTFRNRSELLITETELKLMAAAAKIGLRSNPKNGYRMPAAIGTPTEL